jgi:hypothetical protein
MAALRLQLKILIRVTYHPVVPDGPLVLQPENPIQFRSPRCPPVVVFRPRRCTGEPPVVFWQIFPPQVHIRRFVTGNLLPPQFLHQPVLMRAVHPFDSSLGFRRTRCNHRDSQLRAHTPKLRDRFFPS